MERFFLGGNTAFGFRSFYRDELSSAENVILLKGAPGTGKSTLMRAVASEAAKRGLDCELWHCSGDPSSLDGVYIKELSAVVADATSPHPHEAALPVIAERLEDMARALSREKLLPRKALVIEALNDKKESYLRAYDKLNSALRHYRSAEERYFEAADVLGIKRMAAAFALRVSEPSRGRARRLFSRAITPDGEISFFDHLAGRRVYLMRGGVPGMRLFAEEAAGLLGGSVLFDPLFPERREGVLWKGGALVADAGPFSPLAERIELGDDRARKACAEEEEACAALISEAVRELGNAKAAHERVEKLHADCMDYSVTEEITARVKRMIFEEA